MHFSRPWPRVRPFAVFGFAAIAAAFLAAGSARAATPVSVQLGAQFPPQDTARRAGGTTQATVGLNYDVGPQRAVPVRASLTFDDFNGASGNGRINAYGFGVAGRLTTPLYAGAGIALYSLNVRQNAAGAAATSGTAVSTNLFVGERLFGLPGGTSVSVQATCKAMPSLGGINPSAYGVGVRVQL